jgi:hypothetical protein
MWKCPKLGIYRTDEWSYVDIEHDAGAPSMFCDDEPRVRFVNRPGELKSRVIV